MAVTVAQFTNAFPEFRKTNPEEVRSRLGFALLEINADVWGDKAAQGQMYLTAHLLTMAPQGQQARLTVAYLQTPYGERFKILQKQVSYYARTAGLPNAIA